MSLWDWAVRAYGAADIEALCLDLQDRDGQCVCLLLWAGWTASEGRATTSDEVARTVSIARAWQRQAIGPLRAARRGLKTTLPGVDDSVRDGLRERVQALELSAERLLLEALEAATAAAAGSPRDAAEALVQAATAWNGAAPERLGALADAFSRV